MVSQNEQTATRLYTEIELHSQGILTIPIEQFDPIFYPGTYGPTLATEVRFIFRGSFVVTGGTSDLEAWILAVLAKSRKNIFEFGTCTGKSTYLFAANSPADGHVETLTLPSNQVAMYNANDSDTQSAQQHAIEESRFEMFMYSGTPEEKKITQHFCDSKQFDETKYSSMYDMIFIDGSHAYSYVKSDTEKAMRMVKPGGIILWHDFIWRNLSYDPTFDDPTKDVAGYLGTLAKQETLFHLKDTSLVVFRKPLLE